MAGLTAEVYKLSDPEVKPLNTGKESTTTIEKKGEEPTDPQAIAWVMAIEERFWILQKKKESESSVEARLLAQEKRNEDQQRMIDRMSELIMKTPMLANDQGLQNLVFTPRERIEQVGGNYAPESARQVKLETNESAYA